MSITVTNREGKKGQGIGRLVIMTSLVGLLLAILVALLINLPIKSSQPNTQPDVNIKAVEEQEAREQGNSKPGPSDVSPSQESFLQRMKSRLLNDIIPLTSSEPLRIQDLNAFNNVQLCPRLQAMTSLDYFRFVKLNLKRKCSLWPDDSKCSER